MNTTPSSEDLIDINGPEGETLFWHAKTWLVGSHAGDLQGALDATWEHYKQIKDERLLALVAALCVEGAVDNVLLAFVPGFGACLADSDFKFSVKLKFLRSLRLLPGRIVASCDLIRQVRNEFAHELEKRGFRDLDDKLRSKLLPHVTSFNSKKRDPDDYYNQFTDLVGFTILALLVYKTQASELRTYLETEEGRKAFAQWARPPR